MKIISVVGARPQFVKAAAVSRAFSKKENVIEKIIHTGQHYDANMSDVFFKEMEIPVPSFHFNISETGREAMIAQMSEKIDGVVSSEKPDCVIVYGDTNSCIAGALAARKNHIKLAHVEAGLRSFNLQMPEEINRIATDRISDFLFCPTEKAVANLSNEGIKNPDVKVSLCGDVMYDAFLYYSKNAKKPVSELPDKFVLVTIHRAGNTDDRDQLAALINKLNELHREIEIVFPVHPRTRQKIEEYGISPAFTLYNPVSYFEMLYLLQKCAVVITDSGGLQKEAFFSGKHCVIMREDTEWTELTDAGYNFLYRDLGSFVPGVKRLAERPVFTPPATFYGDGTAAEKIVKILLQDLS